MNYRELGRTGLQVSEIGYGAWGIGRTMWLGADDDESLRALNRAIDLGVTLIDTALGYGERPQRAARRPRRARARPRRSWCRPRSRPRT